MLSGSAPAAHAGDEAGHDPDAAVGLVFGAPSPDTSEVNAALTVRSDVVFPRLATTFEWSYPSSALDRNGAMP
jgi:hypothetical protein